MKQTGQTLEQEFEALISFINQALDTAQHGTPPHLGDLDSTVADLCRRVGMADPQTVKAVQPLMGRMITRLDELAHYLQDFQNKLEERG